MSTYVYNNKISSVEESIDKCFYCGSSKVNSCNEVRNGVFGLTEFELQCNNCNKTLALWSYGQWYIFNHSV